MGTVSHYPFSFLAGFWEQWMIAESSALSPMSVWIRSRHRLPQTHRHQHKHTQPLDIVPYYEVSLPKLPLVRQLANHQASMDPAPQGPSNPADVASVGQQQTLPGGTNAEKRTGTAQHVRLLSPHTHTHTHKNTHTHTNTQPLLHMYHLSRFCWVALNSGVELASYRAASNF